MGNSSVFPAAAFEAVGFDNNHLILLNLAEYMPSCGLVVGDWESWNHFPIQKVEKIKVRMSSVVV